MVRHRQKPRLQSNSQSQTQTPTGFSETTDPTANIRCNDESPADTMSWAARNKWIVLAIASGACAAFNGVFAKL